MKMLLIVLIVIVLPSILFRIIDAQKLGDKIDEITKKIKNTRLEGK